MVPAAAMLKRTSVFVLNAFMLPLELMVIQYGVTPMLTKAKNATAVLLVTVRLGPYRVLR